MMITLIILNFYYHFNLNYEAYFAASHRFSSVPLPKGDPKSNKNLHKNL